jgi:hypothetical protein
VWGFKVAVARGCALRIGRYRLYLAASSIPMRDSIFVCA